MENVKGSTKGFWPYGDLNFWRHSIAVGIVGRLLAAKMEVPHAQQAFLGGLVHDIGKLALLTHNLNDYSETLEEARVSQRPLHVLEKQRFGYTHAEIGGALCEKWWLPAPFRKAIERHHEKPDDISGTLGNIIQTANMIVKIADIGNSGSPFVQNEQLVFTPHPRIDLQNLKAFVHDVPELVNVLTEMVLPQTAPSAGSSIFPIKAPVFTHISRATERTLVELTLVSLGIEPHIDDQGIEELDEAIYIMDQPPVESNSSNAYINFGEWRNAQTDLISSEIDVSVMRTWLIQQLKQAYEQTNAASLSDMPQ